MKYYTGIGSRKTPSHVLADMTNIAKVLDSRGYTLLSGGALGADTAFERGTTRKPNIYRANDWGEEQWALDAVREVSTEFPFDRMKPYVQKLFGRNMYQLEGKNQELRSSFVICWSPVIDPCHKDGGGTRIACRRARKLNIPVFNMNNPKHMGIIQNRILNA